MAVRLHLTVQYHALHCSLFSSLLVGVQHLSKEAGLGGLQLAGVDVEVLVSYDLHSLVDWDCGLPDCRVVLRYSFGAGPAVVLAEAGGLRLLPLLRERLSPLQFRSFEVFGRWLPVASR